MMMKRSIAVTAFAVSLGAGVLGGGIWWVRPAVAAAHGSAQPAAVYSCPMHPDYHSDHPGSCPLCGMALERQQAATPAGATGAPPPGAVEVSPERQQAIGMTLGVVRAARGTRLLRTSGRVLADENRTYPIVASMSGWIRSAAPVATGDAVKKDQVLASFYTPDPQLEMAQQAFYSTLEMMYRVGGTQPQSHDSGRALDVLERVADGLRSLGVPNDQIREMARRREVVHDVRVESPVDGVVLKRDVTLGLRFDRGVELYQIADLSQVRILADMDARQMPFIRRGGAARVTTPGQSRALAATVALSDGTFDETTQTLKVRLDAPNPHAALKPGMFVDVEVPVDFPPSIVVPADAIVDSGLQKRVFVDRGNGAFEPRQIETGWRFGDEVAVTRGLTAGERIVTSGTFFVDSERRMRGLP
jgi:membrane fusion protein, copper/silver efflux system